MEQLYRFYSKPKDTQNRVSVIGQFVDGNLQIAISRCSKRDNFIRKKGRLIAENRLKKGIIYKIIPYKESNDDPKEKGNFFVTNAKQIAQEVANNPQLV
jgi:hypothetical protein